MGAHYGFNPSSAQRPGFVTTSLSILPLPAKNVPLPARWLMKTTAATRGRYTRQGLKEFALIAIGVCKPLGVLKAAPESARRQECHT